jgi:hypothetical protein
LNKDGEKKTVDVHTKECLEEQVEKAYIHFCYL